MLLASDDFNCCQVIKWSITVRFGHLTSGQSDSTTSTVHEHLIAGLRLSPVMIT